MSQGINQDVELLGRTFHVQTEVTGDTSLIVRTAVFVGGKAVATRDSEVPREIRAKGDQAVHLTMKEQHNAVLVNLVERATRFSERQRGEMPREGTSEVAEARPDQPGSEVTEPSLAVDDPVQGAIRVRRIIGKLRHRLQIARADTPTTATRSQIELAGEAFEWVVSHPRFSRLRINEQVRINLVKDRIEAWTRASEGDLSAESADQLWTEITTFGAYLAEINNRTDLVRFDREVLSWAQQQTMRKGMSSEVLRLLQKTYGRDDDLDSLLDQAQDLTAEVWLDRLSQVRARLPEP